MVLDMVKDKNGKYSFTDLGNVTISDAISAVLFFFAVGVNFTNANVDIPTGANSVVSLGSEAFSLAGYSVTWALAIALALVIVQVIQSARLVGRSNDVDVKEYVEKLPTGVTFLLAFVVVSHVALLLGIVPVLDLITANYPAEIATVALNTAGYMAISDSN